MSKICDKHEFDIINCNTNLIEYIFNNLFIIENGIFNTRESLLRLNQSVYCWEKTA